jgi:hypothetical protein
MGGVGLLKKKKEGVGFDLSLNRSIVGDEDLKKCRNEMGSLRAFLSIYYVFL